MYLHIGNNMILRKREILGIFDLDNTSQSLQTRRFLSKAEQAGEVVNAAGEELPKSFVLCVHDGRQTVYLSQLNASTLYRRGELLGVET